MTEGTKGDFTDWKLHHSRFPLWLTLPPSELKQKSSKQLRAIWGARCGKKKDRKTNVKMCITFQRVVSGNTVYITNKIIFFKLVLYVILTVPTERTVSHPWGPCGWLSPPRVPTVLFEHNDRWHAVPHTSPRQSPSACKLKGRSLPHCAVPVITECAEWQDARKEAWRPHTFFLFYKHKLYL